MESGHNSQGNVQDNQNEQNKQIKLRTKDSCQKVNSLKNNKDYVKNSHTLTSKLKMKLVLSKFRPYLSLPDDEKKLIICLKNLGVECIYDLLLLDFEKDLDGIINVIQCRKLRQEVINDLSMQYFSTLPVNPNVSIPSRVEQAPLPQFTPRVINSLENGIVSKDDQCVIVETLSKHMFDVIENPGMRDCRKIVSLLEKQFPNGFRNKESRFNEEYVSKQVIQRIYYLKRKKHQLQLKEKGVLPRNDCVGSKISKQKKLRYGTHPDRYLPVTTEEEQMFSYQEQVKTWLKSMYLVCYITKLENMENKKWSFVAWKMRDTYAAQRKTIVNSESISTILEDWPFLGKGAFLKDHFFTLTNRDISILKKCELKIPLILKFVEAEVERERKDVELQIRLNAIMRKRNMNRDSNGFLTIIACLMAIMKENFERMFVVLEDSDSFDELQSNAKLIPTPVVACLGDIWSQGRCYVFIGEQCLWREPEPVNEAIQIMFIAYFVFDIMYPKELAGILQFMQKFMFKIEYEGNRVEKRPLRETYVPKLLKLMDDYASYVKRTCVCKFF